MYLFEQAEWIWLDGYDAVNTYVRFTETVPKREGRATLYLSVDTNYALYVNERLVSFGQYADFPFDKIYETVDLTDLFTEEENTLRLDCYHQGWDSSTARAERAGLIYALWAEDTCILASRTGVSAAPILQYDMAGVELVSGQLGFSFRYDSRRADGDVCRAVAVDKPLPKRARPIEPLLVGEDEPIALTVYGSYTEAGGNTIGERMQYAALSYAARTDAIRLPHPDGIQLKAAEGTGGIFVLLDTGRENAGILSLDLDLPADAEVLIGWGEHLEDLRVRAYVGGRNFACSYHGMAGKNRFVHPFRRLGMRYLELHIAAPSATIRYAGIRTTDYPLATETVFTCADKLHERIHAVSKRTLLLCMHEHYEDCPWREQALYSMDSRNQMLCGYYTFKEYAFPRASLQLLASSIREDNLLELCAPARVSITIPSFTAMYLTAVAEYEHHSGDTTLADEVMPVLLRIADDFLRRMDADGNDCLACYPERPYWNFYEWQDGLSGAIGDLVAEENITRDAPLMAFVSLGFRNLALLLQSRGNTAAARYQNAHERLNRALNAYFWDETHQAYASYRNKAGTCYHFAELTNALAVVAGAAEGERLDAVLRHFTTDTLIPVTLSHSIFKYDALMQQPEQYARFVFRDIAEKWGAMLKNNATTFWETADGASAFGNAGSLCHGWSAIPIYFYEKYAMTMTPALTGLHECQLEVREL